MDRNQIEEKTRIIKCYYKDMLDAMNATMVDESLYDENISSYAYVQITEVSNTVQVCSSSRDILRLK